ncbi:MAG: lysylphosphatidylglycerol synthase domain-containing protein [Candidatus Nanohaloarchaea archaeon]
MLLSMGVSSDFTPLYFVLVLSSFGNFSPTPGGSGTFEALMAAVLTFFLPHITFATALAVAIIFRLTTYWPGLAIGYLALNSLGNGG